MQHNKQTNVTIFLIHCMLLFSLAACSGNGTQNVSPSTAPDVNGFGPATNHVHSLLAISPMLLLLATHDGTYRSENAGQTWEQVSGGKGQLMQGLMDYSLTTSPLNPQRLYLLTMPAISQPQGVPGLYTSTDRGRTWRLTASAARFAAGNIFFVAAGNETPDEVYLYFPAQGMAGLKVSRDAGKHFADEGPLPFANLLGLLALPGTPGHLFAYGENGIARSMDGGKHWQTIQDITGGIINLTSAGPHRPLYANGDAGIFVSTDEGKTFRLVNTHQSYGDVCVSPTSAQTLYGKTGTMIYRSMDGGHSWRALPHIAGNLGNLAVDPANAQQVYLSLSYPTQIYRLDRRQAAWISLTPHTLQERG